MHIRWFSNKQGNRRADNMFKPKNVKKEVNRIKKENNLNGLTNKDVILYIAHRVDSLDKRIELFGDCLTDVKVDVATNKEKINWTSKGMIALFGIIGTLATAAFLMSAGMV